jgi:hypothetical protein
MRVAVEEDVTLEIERLLFGRALTCTRTLYECLSDRRRSGGRSLNCGDWWFAVLARRDWPSVSRVLIFVWSIPFWFLQTSTNSNITRVAHEILLPIYRGVGIEDSLLPNGIALEESRGEILSVGRPPHYSRLMSPVQLCSFRIYADLPQQSCNCPCLVDQAIVGETSDRSCEVEGC